MNMQGAALKNRLSRSPLARTVLVCAGMLLLFGVAQGQETAHKKSVLVLYWYGKDFPGNVQLEQSFKDALAKDRNLNVDYFAEYLEEDRFPGEQQAQLLHDYLLRKYADRKIDVVVAVTDAPFKFLLQHRSDLFTQTPIVFLAINPPANDILAADPGMTGIVPVRTHKQTVDLALKLHPDTQQLFFISGTPQHDKRLETIARTELQSYESKLKIEYLTDLSQDELVARTRNLPAHSLILYAWQQSRDQNGQFVETWDTLATISATATVPIYGMGSANVGRGIVGGYVSGAEGNGARLAEMAALILNGKRAQDIPVEDAPAGPMFDWRQLKRWNISQQSLPAGSDIRFEELSFWELYKWRIVGVLSLLLLQTAFIAVLLVERRRRRLANESLDRLNAELEVRIEARTAALNAKSRELESFAYSVAHDLKAPLRGIDGYSRLLLEEYAAKLDHEGRNFLQTIQSSTDEMNQLIDDLLAYSRLERRELKTDRLELAPIINSLVEEKKRETTDRPVDFVVDVNGAAVLADASGLAQSLRNYLDNAIKFTAKVKAPRIEVGSTEAAERCLVWVRDNGIGFDMKYHERIFDIFQRLNVADDYPGTGIGLAIVRKAMERMGGRAWAESEPGHGATFYLEIPR
jgi:signal transduction histidine kinase